MRKRKDIKINPNLIAKDNGINLDRYNLPQTLGNPPESVQKINDSAFQMIKPQLESMVADANCNHMLTSLGILRFTDSTFLGYGTLANLSQNSLIRAGVEMRADEMTRRWGEVTRKGTDDAVKEDDTKVAEITQEMERYKIADIFRSASCLNGYLGGCLLFIDTGADKNDLVNPLILDASTFVPGSLKGFRIIEPYLVTPGGYNSVDPMADDFFKPSTWYVQGIPVHSSRLIYFAENKLTSLLKPSYNFFGLPLAQKVLDAVAHYTQNRESAGRLLQKYSLTVLKTNLENVLAGGFDTDLKHRIEYFVQHRNNDGCTAIDKEQEDIVIQTTTLGGVVDIVRQSMEYVASMFNEPMVKLWGLSPAGFSSGDLELKNHYDNIKSQQEKMFSEQIKRVIDVIQQDLYGEIDEGIVFTFAPLSEEDEKVVAETNKIQADTDIELIEAGVITPAEARQRLIDDDNSGYNTLTEDVDFSQLTSVQNALDMNIGGKFDGEMRKKYASLMLNKLGIEQTENILADIEKQMDDKNYSQFGDAE